MTKKENKSKVVIAWILLILLIIMLLALNYIKFFESQIPNIEEKPVGNSSEKAVNTALQQIVDNFNQHEKVKEYAKQGIQLKAILNGFSIYISYTTDTTTTYEFTYHDLTLDIEILNETENIKKFKTIYEILIYATQERIGNTEIPDQYILDLLNENTEYDGLSKEIKGNLLAYHMDITKKIKINEESSTTNEEELNTQAEDIARTEEQTIMSED